MELYFVKLTSALLMPPACNFVLMAVGAWLRARRRWLGGFLIWFGALSLLALSTDVVSGLLAQGLERYPARSIEYLRASGAEAIVVLAGGRYPEGPEFGRETVASAALERIRYAAFVARGTGLPVLVSGGSVHGEQHSEASLMAAASADEFGVPVRWVEGRSRTTAENAQFSGELLRAEGIGRVVLVTHASHMWRSVSIFARYGVDVVPAPTKLQTQGDGDYPFLSSILPTAGALFVSTAAIHEYLGLAWYAIRY